MTSSANGAANTLHYTHCKSSKFNHKPHILMSLLYLLFFFLFISTFTNGASSSEKIQLMLLKTSLSPDNSSSCFDNWLSALDPCNPQNFTGVSCNATTGNITSIFLEQCGFPDSSLLIDIQLPFLVNFSIHDSNMHGQIPDFTNLPKLQTFSIKGNQIFGLIPDFTNIPNLQILNLETNYLTGNIPDFANLPNLMEFSLSSNQAQGYIPNFSNLPKLEILNIEENNLSGQIPDFNLPNLLSLSLNFNPDLFGPIPSLSNLPNLQILKLDVCHLTGTIPEFNNNPNLQYISLNVNLLTGPIPDFNLPNLKHLSLKDNQLTGSIPLFPHLQYLQELSLDTNQLTGEVPDFNLQNLQTLSLGHNSLTGSVPDFSNLPNLNTYSLRANQLTGSIPNFSNLPNLQFLDLGVNQLTGYIPNFSNLPNLMELSLDTNQFEGNIPDFTNLPNLWALDLHINQLRGSVPDFSNLPNLFDLDLDTNHLTGAIPDFSAIPNLQSLNLVSNQLSGNIPDFSNLPNLGTIYLYTNHLSGTIPNFSNIPQISEIDLSDNLLTFEIPQFSLCPNLVTLILNNNPVTGTIPIYTNKNFLNTLSFTSLNLTGFIPSFDSLPVLTNLRLSNNHFSGINITNHPSLHVLDVSNNQLTSLPATFTPPHLLDLDLSGNQIKTLPLNFTNTLPSVTSLICKNCGLTLVPGDLGSISLLDLSSNSIRPAFIKSCFGSYQFLLGSCGLTDTLRSLYLNDNPINLDFNQLVALLPVHYPSILEIDSTGTPINPHDVFLYISTIPSMEKLSIRNNPISSTSFRSDLVQFSDSSLILNTSYLCGRPILSDYPSLELIVDPSLFDYSSCSCRSGYYGTPPSCHSCSTLTIPGTNCVLPPDDTGVPGTGFTIPEPITNYFLIDIPFSTLNNSLQTTVTSHPTTIETQIPLTLINSSQNLITYTECPHVDHLPKNHLSGLLDIQYSVGRSACIRNTSSTSMSQRRYGQNICLPGYTNRTCSQCLPNYYKSGISCQKCESSQFINILEYILAIILLLGLLFVLYRSSIKSLDAHFIASVSSSSSTNDLKLRNPDVASIVKIVITFTQILNTVPLMGVRTPAWSSYIFSQANSAFSLHLEGLECFGLSPHNALVYKFWISFYTPLAICLIVFAIYNYVKYIYPYPPPTSWNLINIRVILSFLTLMYFPLVKIMVSPFGNSTTPLESSLQKSYINTAQYFLKDSNDPLWQSLSTGAIIGTIIYVVGIPLVVISLITLNFEHLKPRIQKQPSTTQMALLANPDVPEDVKTSLLTQLTQASQNPLSNLTSTQTTLWFLFGYYFEELCSDTFWWPCIDFIRSLSIPLLLILLPFTSAFRPILFFLIILSQLATLDYFRPYKEQRINTLAILCWFFLLVYYSCAVFIDFASVIHPSPNDPTIDKFLPIWILVFSIVALFELYLIYSIWVGILRPAIEKSKQESNKETPLSLKLAFQRFLPIGNRNSDLNIPILYNSSIEEDIDSD